MHRRIDALRETRRGRSDVPAAPTEPLLVGAAAAALGAGMALMYFLDPERGRGRRAQTVDRIAGMFRQTGRRTALVARHAAAEAYGIGQQVRHLGPDSGKPENDAVLAHKVESVLFRDRDIDKGHMNINAENGVVVLRGIAETPERIKDIEGRVKAIDGVRDVENLLHLPNTLPPTRVDATVH